MLHTHAVCLAQWKGCSSVPFVRREAGNTRTSTRTSRAETPRVPQRAFYTRPLPKGAGPARARTSHLLLMSYCCTLWWNIIALWCVNKACVFCHSICCPVSQQEQQAWVEKPRGGCRSCSVSPETARFPHLAFSLLLLLSLCFICVCVCVFSLPTPSFIFRPPRSPSRGENYSVKFLWRAERYFSLFTVAAIKPWRSVKTRALDARLAQHSLVRFRKIFANLMRCDRSSLINNLVAINLWGRSSDTC